MFESVAAPDTAVLRKARGAFFTSDAITRYIAEWAIRTPHDTVLEPSAGDAAFLVQAVRRLRELGIEAPGSMVLRSIRTVRESLALGSRRLGESPI